MATELHVSFCAVDAADGGELAELRVAAMRESLERVGRFDPVRARERFLAGFAPQHTRHILCSGSRVGFLVVKQQGEHLLLDHLYIRPGHQGQGIGATVLAQVFAEAGASGRSVRVGALKDSDSNRFYARHGFVLVEQAEFDNYYLRPSNNAL